MTLAHAWPADAMTHHDAALARLVRAVGTPAFGDALLELLCEAVCGTDQIVGYARGTGQPGVHLFSAGCLPPALAGALTRRYLDSYHRLDPGLSDFACATPPGDAWLTRMNPAMPASSVYKDFFFHRGRLADRIALATQWDNTLVACHLYRSQRSACFSEADVAALQAWTATLAAALRQHYVLCRVARPQPALPDPRAAALAGLSPRERDVFHRLLSGLSTEAIALDLGVSHNTVRTFRKKLYRKLAVTSRFDLYDRYVHHADARPAGTPAAGPHGTRR